MKILTALFLTLLLFMTVGLFVPKINQFTIEKVKNNMEKNGTYGQIHQIITQQVVDNQALSQDPTINDIVQQTITQNYIQAKLDSTLDQSAAWVVGSSQTEPTISFNDLKQSLMDQHPQGADIDQILQQLQDMPQQFENAPQVTDDPQAQAALDSLLSNQETLQSFSQGDITFHLKNYLQPLKFGYTVYSISLIALPLLIIAILALTIFTRKDKLQTTAYIFTFMGLGLALLGLLSQVILLAWIFPASYAQLDQHFPLGSSLGQSITGPWFTNYLIIHLAIATPLIITGLVCYFLARRQSKSEPKVTPLTQTTSSTPTLDSDKVDPTPKLQTT